MKILVIQLARFGDIYLTWPTLRALRRNHPGAEIHFLVREKFLHATDGLSNVCVHGLPTADILAPLLTTETDSADLDRAEAVLSTWLKTLEGEWDLIINLSFSPASSFLTNLLATSQTVVKGYTRHADGFLAIPDDGSAYFYAQVGVGRDNRFHLVDVFAMIAQVELQKSDWGYEGELSHTSRATPYVVVHLGASQSEKRYPLRHFKKVLEQLSQRQVYLIGSKEERTLADSMLSLTHVKSLIGETSLVDLFSLIRHADLVIGADSAPVHIASHMNTPVLNLSFDFVNFWETGPISEQSVVLHAAKPESLSPESVAQTALAMLQKTSLPSQVITLAKETVPRFLAEPTFAWSLIQALYTDANYPTPLLSATISGVKRLQEICDMALEQLQILKRDLGSKIALEILGSADHALGQIAQLAPELSPLIRWFETERLRIPPQELALTFQQTNQLFQDLKTITQVLMQEMDADFYELERQGLERLREIESEIAPCATFFRLYQTAKAEPMLQRMLSHLTFFETNGLHHAPPTKVERGQKLIQDWEHSYEDYREILHQMVQAFQKQDYIYVADLIEYEISDCLSQWRTQLVKFDTSMLA